MTANSLLARMEPYRKAMLALRQDIHRHPETAREKVRTAFMREARPSGFVPIGNGLAERRPYPASQAYLQVQRRYTADWRGLLGRARKHGAFAPGMTIAAISEVSPKTHTPSSSIRKRTEQHV